MADDLVTTAATSKLGDYQAIPTGYDEIIAVLDSLPVIVREARRRKRQSLREAAADAGVSFSTLNRCEANVGSLNLSSAVALLRWAAT